MWRTTNRSPARKHTHREATPYALSSRMGRHSRIVWHTVCPPNRSSGWLDQEMSKTDTALPNAYERSAEHSPNRPISRRVQTHALWSRNIIAGKGCDAK